jgi:hypothetical protein
MKKLIICFAIAFFTLTTYSQVSDTLKTAKYQCLIISRIMDQKITDVLLDDGIKVKSIGVKNENGAFFKTNTEVLNYVCTKYKLELVTVSENKDVTKFYLVRR